MNMAWLLLCMTLTIVKHAPPLEAAIKACPSMHTVDTAKKKFSGHGTHVSCLTSWSSSPAISGRKPMSCFWMLSGQRLITSSTVSVSPLLSTTASSLRGGCVGAAVPLLPVLIRE